MNTIKKIAPLLSRTRFEGCTRLDALYLANKKNLHSSHPLIVVCCSMLLNEFRLWARFNNHIVSDLAVTMHVKYTVNNRIYELF